MPFAVEVSKVWLLGLLPSPNDALPLARSPLEADWVIEIFPCPLPPKISPLLAVMPKPSVLKPREVETYKLATACFGTPTESESVAKTAIVSIFPGTTESGIVVPNP